MTKLNTAFPSKLQLIRKKYDLTQEEFAQTLMISRSHLAKLEAGIIPPSTKIIKHIALHLDIPEVLLLDDTDEDIILPEGSKFIDTLLLRKYNLLDEEYKTFVRTQINQLLALQLKIANKKDS